MKIGLKAREQGTHRCPYCHDGVVRGPACSACSAQYHKECAETFGKCAARGCSGTFQGVLELIQAIPRLALLARRINRWQTGDLVGRATAVVVLMPTPRELHSKRAADVIGEVLGQTAYDGRLRLGSAYPEPLVRVSDPGRLAAVLAKLKSAQLSAIAPPLVDVVAPLEAFEVTRVTSLAGPVRFENAQGEAIAIEAGERLLAIPCQLQLTERMSGGPLMATTSHVGAQRGRSSKRAAPKRADRRERQMALYLFRAGDPRPIVLREMGLKDYDILRGEKTVSTHHNMRALVDAVLKHGGEVQEMAKTVVLNQAFLIPTDHLGAKRSNEPVVALVARLMRLAWESKA